MRGFSTANDPDRSREVNTGESVHVDRPVSAQYGSCAVTVMPRDTVVIAAGGKLLVVTEDEAWDLGRALTQVAAGVGVSFPAARR